MRRGPRHVPRHILEVAEKHERLAPFASRGAPCEQLAAEREGSLDASRGEVVAGGPRGASSRVGSLGRRGRPSGGLAELRGRCRRAARPCRVGGRLERRSCFAVRRIEHERPGGVHGSRDRSRRRPGGGARRAGPPQARARTRPTRAEGARNDTPRRPPRRHRCPAQARGRRAMRRPPPLPRRLPVPARPARAAPLESARAAPGLGRRRATRATRGSAAEHSPRRRPKRPRPGPARAHRRGCRPRPRAGARAAAARTSGRRATGSAPGLRRA